MLSKTSVLSHPKKRAIFDKDSKIARFFMPINLSSEQFQSLLDKYIREAVAEMQRRVRSANLVSPVK